MNIDSIAEEANRRLLGLLDSDVLPVYANYRHDIHQTRTRQKADGTILSEADIEIQRIIFQVLLDISGTIPIVAEESGELENIESLKSGSFWVVDPIDGTREFMNPRGQEFCTVIGLVKDFRPIASFVLAPGSGVDSSPLYFRIDSVTQEIQVNGLAAALRSSSEITKQISVTRSSGVAPREFERKYLAKGYSLKTTSTSQSLDLLRIAIQLSDYSDLELPCFDVFFRQQQRLWDGIIGLTLAEVNGFSALDISGNSLLPMIDAWISRSLEFQNAIYGPINFLRGFLEVYSED